MKPSCKAIDDLLRATYPCIDPASFEEHVEYILLFLVFEMTLLHIYVVEYCMKYLGGGDILKVNSACRGGLRACSEETPHQKPHVSIYYQAGVDGRTVEAIS